MTDLPIPAVEEVIALTDALSVLKVNFEAEGATLQASVIAKAIALLALAHPKEPTPEMVEVVVGALRACEEQLDWCADTADLEILARAAITAMISPPDKRKG